jgi:hypothetical protein
MRHRWKLDVCSLMLNDTQRRIPTRDLKSRDQRLVNSIEQRLCSGEQPLRTSIRTNAIVES